MIKKKDKNQARIKRHYRIRNKISGTAERPRMSVYRSLNHIYVQFIDDVAGNTLASASTMDKELASKLSGKKKTEAGCADQDFAAGIVRTRNPHVMGAAIPAIGRDVTSERRIRHFSTPREDACTGGKATVQSNIAGMLPQRWQWQRNGAPDGAPVREDSKRSYSPACRSERVPVLSCESVR